MTKNPFKDIETDKEVPADIKKSVLKELSLIQLITDVSDLFFNKAPSIIKEAFKEKK